MSEIKIEIQVYHYNGDAPITETVERTPAHSVA